MLLSQPFAGSGVADNLRLANIGMGRLSFGEEYLPEQTIDANFVFHCNRRNRVIRRGGDTVRFQPPKQRLWLSLRQLGQH